MYFAARPKRVVEISKEISNSSKGIFGVDQIEYDHINLPETETLSCINLRTHDRNLITPVQYRLEDSFTFLCRKEIACAGRCCYRADVTLTPYCILRLSRYLKLEPRDFLAHYTVPTLLQEANLPVVKLKMDGADGDGPCPFLIDNRCSIYEQRPVTCRYYPLGLAAIGVGVGASVKNNNDFYFLIKENHCLGHLEQNEQTVASFRCEQQIENCDLVNRGWIDILMKAVSWKTTSGPYGKEISVQAKRMFFTVSTDVIAFRQFVFSTSFLKIYEVSHELSDTIAVNDEKLLEFGFNWMKNVLFNERTISVRKHVLQDAIARIRD